MQSRDAASISMAEVFLLIFLIFSKCVIDSYRAGNLLAASIGGVAQDGLYLICADLSQDVGVGVDAVSVHEPFGRCESLGDVVDYQSEGVSGGVPSLK